MTGIVGFDSAASPTPVAAHLVGYRAWRLGGFGHNKDKAPGRLFGIYKDEYAWSAGVNEATCLRDVPKWKKPGGPPPPNDLAVDHEAKWDALHTVEPVPVQECGCGFWAYTDLAEQPGRTLQGVIHGWGPMVCGPLGFRCRFARIVALSWWEADERPDMAAAIQARYPDAAWFGTATLWMKDTYPASDLAALVGESA